MKYSITLVKITKNVSGPVSINFVSLASEPSLLVLRHDRCFGTSVVSARALLRHERCFGTSVASARSLLRHERFFARGKVRGLEQRESARGQQGVWHLIIMARPPANLVLVSNISEGRETRVSQR